MNIQHVVIDLELKDPVKILHLSDVHLSYADMDDAPNIQQKAIERRNRFENGNGDGEPSISLTNVFQEALEIGNSCDLVVLNGDVVDMLAYGSLRMARKLLDQSGCCWVYNLGNHELCYGPGNDPSTIEEKAYRLSNVQPYFSNSLLFSSKIINGVNIITMDNGTHSFSKQQYESLRFEIEKGYPILLFVHIPLYAETLAEYLTARGKSASMVGVPGNISSQPEKENIRSDSSNMTSQTVSLINGSKCVKAVFAGHMHFPHTSVLPGGAVQYLNGALFERHCTVIDVR